MLVGVYFAVDKPGTSNIVPLKSSTPKIHEAGSLCGIWETKQPPVWSPAKKGKSMKAIKSFTAIVAALAFLASVSVAAEKSCCEKAKEAGKECAHKCCKDAAKDGKTCEKCNPKKEAK